MTLVEHVVDAAAVCASCGRLPVGLLLLEAGGVGEASRAVLAGVVVCFAVVAPEPELDKTSGAGGSARGRGGLGVGVGVVHFLG